MFRFGKHFLTLGTNLSVVQFLCKRESPAIWAFAEIPQTRRNELAQKAIAHIRGNAISACALWHLKDAQY